MAPADARLPVLVVEDSDDDYDTIVEGARRAGVPNPLVHAPDAAVARARLGEPHAYAFVLLDHNLPGTDGLDLLAELRALPGRATLPVVVFTTSGSARDCAAFYRAGANAYHVKSVRFDECIDTLQAVFGYWLRRVALPPAPSRSSR